MHKERFSVEWSIEGTVEILLSPTATESQITKAAERAVRDELRKGRGGLPGELMIGNYEGPY